MGESLNTLDDHTGSSESFNVVLITDCLDTWSMVYFISHINLTFNIIVNNMRAKFTEKLIEMLNALSKLIVLKLLLHNRVIFKLV